jgi:tetratricopeptide (TPR) repeat protein
MFDLALETIERGAGTDPSVRELTQDVVGFIHFGRSELPEAEAAFRRALETHPRDPNLHQWYSQLLATVGDTAGSLQHARIAKRLDSLSPVVNDRLAVALLWADLDDEAHAQFALADELGATPNVEARLVLLLRRREFGRAGEVLLGLQQLFARADAWVAPFLASLEDPAMRPAARRALAQAAGERQVSLKYLFGAWVYLGEGGQAVDAALRLLEDRSQAKVEFEFVFAREGAPLRSHPRFAELATRMGLVRHWDAYGWPPQCTRKGTGIECR